MERVQNGTIWADGRLRAWTEVGVPLMSDAVLRGLAVFDGLIADRHHGVLALLAGEAHARRLVANARVLRLASQVDVAQVLDACLEAASAEAESSGTDVIYVRPMLVGAPVVSDARGDTTLTVAAFAQRDVAVPDPVRLQLAAWRRPQGDSLPAQVKAVTNYQLSRVVRLAARAAGYDDALVLNTNGRLAESAGAAVLVESDGVVRTPPPWEDALDSVTVRVLARLAEAEGIPLVHEPVSLAAVHAADGLALAGTLSDVVPVSSLDDVALPGGPLLDLLRDRFLDARRGGRHLELLDYWSGRAGAAG